MTGTFDELAAALATRVAAAIRDAAPEVTYAAPVHAVALAFEWGTGDEHMWLPLTIPLAASRLADADDEQHWDPWSGRESAEARGVGLAQERLAADPDVMRLAGTLSDAHDEIAERGEVLGVDDLYDEERYAMMVGAALDAEPPQRWGFEVVEPFTIVLVAGGSERFDLMNIRRTARRRGLRPRPTGS